MSKKRLFIAIALPDNVKEELEKVQNPLKRFVRNAKWVNPAGIHLTLKFLGYVDPEQMPRIEQSLISVSENFSPVDIRIQGCGFFPNPRRPRVIWAGIHAEALKSIQEAVENAMMKLGFEKEDREFQPHLTLARLKNSRGPLPHLISEAEKWKSKRIGEFTAKSFKLYESILRREGAQYYVLREFSLGTTDGD